MLMEVRLPSLGDDGDAVPGGKISAWLARPGDLLNEGDDLLELITDKAAFVVPAPFRGILRETNAAEEQTVKVGDLLCIMDVVDA